MNVKLTIAVKSIGGMVGAEEGGQNNVKCTKFLVKQREESGMNNLLFTLILDVLGCFR